MQLAGVTGPRIGRGVLLLLLLLLLMLLLLLLLVLLPLLLLPLLLRRLHVSLSHILQPHLQTIVSANALLPFRRERLLMNKMNSNKN